MNIPIPIHIQKKTLKKAAQKFPMFVGSNMFISFLALLLVAILIAAFLFYRYAFSIQSISADTQVTRTNFQEQTLVEILEEVDVREVLFNAVDSKTYPNIFSPPLIPSEESEG